MGGFAWCSQDGLEALPIASQASDARLGLHRIWVSDFGGCRSLMSLPMVSRSTSVTGNSRPFLPVLITTKKGKYESCAVDEQPQILPPKVSSTGASGFAKSWA